MTQISADNPFVRFGPDAWAEYWTARRTSGAESRVPAPDAETDLFAGLEDRRPGPDGWASEVAAGHRAP